MSESVRNDDNLSCDVRVEEYLNIKAMIDEFGSAAYPAVHRHYLSYGHESGYDLLLTLLKEEAISREGIIADPPGKLLLLLQELFTRRGGNQPIFGRDGDTVSFKTERNVYCPSPVDQKQTEVLKEFVPEIEIQYTNVSSRTTDPQADSMEALQAVSPW